MKYPILILRWMAIAAAMALSMAVVADPVLTPNPADGYLPKDYTDAAGFNTANGRDPISAWRVPDSSLSWADIHNVIPSGSADLAVDITGLTNSERDASGPNGLLTQDFSDVIWETCSGPYPFEFGEADLDYSSYRHCRDGGGIEVSSYFGNYNTNDWPGGQCNYPEDCPSMTIAYRILSDDGFYDGRASFTGDEDSITQITTITEGPFVNMVTSDVENAGKVLIAFETSHDCEGVVGISRLGTFTGEDTIYTVDKDGASQNYYRHEIQITGLTPSRRYQYQASCSGDAGDVRSGQYTFRSAPARGANRRASFAFIADTRQGTDSMEMRSMGVNLTTSGRMAADAYRRRADIFVVGGDLINGYSTEEWDFRAQLKAWKRAMGGFWRTRPIVAAIGNHEVLMDNYDYTQADYDGWVNYRFGLDMDKRDINDPEGSYANASAEAVFAHEFWHPENGPDPSDPERPTYKENVYSFQYGQILFIAANNNYWYTANDFVDDFGGSPEGYMMDDQLDWIEDELVDAESDPTIKYIFFYFQEPVFPNSTHVTDVMWWNGNNNIMAYEANDTEDAVEPVTDEAGNTAGIIEVRNRFWEAVAQSSKVAAVLTGDEHVYHRTRIDSNTSVGMMSDDTVLADGTTSGSDGIIDWDGIPGSLSANPNFRCPVWHLTISGGGAPWYGQVATPWSDNVEAFSSQMGYGMFRTTGRGISYTLYSLNGQVLDRISNLMNLKNQCN